MVLKMYYVIILIIGIGIGFLIDDYAFKINNTSFDKCTNLISDPGHTAYGTKCDPRAGGC